MNSRLEPILIQKQREVADLYRCLQEDSHHSMAKLLDGDLQNKRVSNFKKVLKLPTLAVIAEIKRKSPSKGLISPISDPVSLAKRYISGGASALSILTDKEFFGGDLNDIIQVENIIRDDSVPIIRKDFIIDKVQIAEAYHAGASAVLCIITILGDKAKALIEFAHTLGMDVLVEIHDQDELLIALDNGADIIGINNRNLKTFEVDTNCALKLVKAIPDTIVKVAESGITHSAMAREYYHAGFDAVLIGEALVKSPDPEQFIMECRYG